MDFIGTDSQLTGIVAVGFADEAPDKRPRKSFEEIVEYRYLDLHHGAVPGKEARHQAHFLQGTAAVAAHPNARKKGR